MDERMRRQWAATEAQSFGRGGVSAVSGATGMSRNNALVAVSSGLLQAMNKDEAEAVLGHEVAHVANGDMVTQTLLMGVLNSFVFVFSIQ